MEQGVKDVQENQTTVEKFEKNFTKSIEESKTKSRRERKESTNMVL